MLFGRHRYQNFPQADLSGLIERGPSLSSSFWDRRQQGACFSDDAVLELRVAHLAEVARSTGFAHAPQSLLRPAMHGDCASLPRRSSAALASGGSTRARTVTKSPGQLGITPALAGVNHFSSDRYERWRTKNEQGRAEWQFAADRERIETTGRSTQSLAIC